jgi:N-acyl amino acid synthase FeeM
VTAVDRQDDMTFAVKPAPSSRRARPPIEFREAGPQDAGHIQKLRETIYVSAENRIGEVDDFAGSFDRYNDYSKWFVAISEGCAVGVVKVIRDSELGLPYEIVLGRGKRDAKEVYAEIGHLLSISGPQSQPVVLGLMREAFAYCSNELGATHVVGDVFVDKRRGDAFYHRIGFTTLHGPYKDDRFINAPMSAIVVLKVADLAPLMRRCGRTLKELLRYLTGACNDPEMRRAADS